MIWWYLYSLGLHLFYFCDMIKNKHIYISNYKIDLKNISYGLVANK